jgi:hypothetical protein
MSLIEYMQMLLGGKSFYLVVFLVFVFISYFFWSPFDNSQLKGSLIVDQGIGISQQDVGDMLESRLMELGHTQISCSDSLFPTLKCDFSLESSKAEENYGIERELKARISEIAFVGEGLEVEKINSNLSCFSLNNLQVFELEDSQYYGSLSASCVINLKGLVDLR